MLERYGEFMTNARRSATPDILPDIWEQSPSPVRQNQLGIAPRQRGRGYRRADIGGRPAVVEDS